MRYTLNECYKRPFSNCIVLSKRDGTKMNFTWNHLHTHELRFSGILEYFYFNAYFWGENFKNSFVWKQMFLKCNFQRSFSADGYKQFYPTEKNTLTTEISFESDFYDFLKKMHFTRNLKIMKSINLKLMYLILFILA